MKEVLKTFFNGLMKVSALIPAKGFTNAKQRLAPLLGAGERALLAEAMLRDVLSQVLMARGLEAIFVVTGDGRVSEIASSLGTQVIQEEEERGETEAVVLALGQMKRRGVEAALVVPADLPLLRSKDIELLLEQISGYDSGPFALLTPSHDRMGSNALLLSPSDVIKLRFGYDSFSYHLSEVAAQGLPLRVVENERIGLDIDEPKDLERFLSAGRGCGETYDRLLKMGVVESLHNAHRSGRL